jgi:probable addiction module antidote protein
MNQKTKISELPIFEVVDYLKTDQDRDQYLAVVLENGDSDLLAAAIEDIAKAKEMHR